MLKRLWFIFGPILISMLLLAAFLLFAPDKTTHRLYDEKRAATALTPIVFKNASLKKEALSDPDHRFVPFFGSSEWKRLDEMHPSVLSQAYNRNYTPFLLGLKGAESLTHYFGMQQIKPELNNKQAVFVISPQWFIKRGQSPGAFNFYFASDQGYRFLEGAKNTAADKYAAKRFLKMAPTSSLSRFMEKIAEGKPLSQIDKWQINVQKKLAVHEDNLFAGLQFGDNFKNVVKPRAKLLPQPYNLEALQSQANQLGKLNTNNNQFGILNSFYTSQIRDTLSKLQNAQRTFSYVKSPEYNDLQLVLTEFAKQKTDVIFVIPPINGKWQSYTGLSEEMYQTSVDKIRYQLSSQGFHHVADLSKKGNEPYFMQDTIHLGWNGWLAFDHHVDKFLTTKQKTPTYKLNDYFFSPEWANATEVNK
ncbi:D-alanyl-lipoteichoic acid biosynthesis protein DltD [Pseudolactococcus piscium]|nr:D-alanyl-lipoteichoic acid biosynthesis protein DltD [Lactococcus piscium]